MIDTRVIVFCENYRFGQRPECDFSERLSFDHVPEPDELTAALKDAGYVTDDDGKHWCPRHADRGRQVTVGPDYQEIAPGVLARAPRHVGLLLIEVKQVKVDA